MSEKLYPCLLEVHLDGLDKESHDIRLKEINSFNNSIQTMRDKKFFITMELKNIKRNLRHIKL